MKALYMDCAMGAAGDTLTAALLELLPQPEAFVPKRNAPGIPGVQFKKENSVKCGIAGTHISVTVHGKGENRHALHNHDRHYVHTHEHHHLSHQHSHHHSGLYDIEHIVAERSPVCVRVKDDVMAVYQLVAEAQGSVHNVPVKEIHFHEIETMHALPI